MYDSEPVAWELAEWSATGKSKRASNIRCSRGRANHLTLYAFGDSRYRRFYLKMAEVDMSKATRELLLPSISDVWAEYQTLGGIDQVAKGTELKRKILAAETARSTSA